MSVRRARAAIWWRRSGIDGADHDGDSCRRVDWPGGGDGSRACHAGAPGVGDAYYPLYGNGGYDVAHYLLKLSYDPATDRLAGVATISARATEKLCRSTSTSRA